MLLGKSQTINGARNISLSFLLFKELFQSVLLLAKLLLIDIVIAISQEDDRHACVLWHRLDLLLDVVEAFNKVCVSVYILAIDSLQKTFLVWVHFRKDVILVEDGVDL